jgi:hypothetical protein
MTLLSQNSDSILRDVRLIDTAATQNPAHPHPNSHIHGIKIARYQTLIVE